MSGDEARLLSRAATPGDSPKEAGSGNLFVRMRGLTVALWVAIAFAMNLLVPQLEEVVSRASQPVIPDTAESIETFQDMDRKFGGSGAQSVAFIVLANPDGLSAADDAHYADLVDRLRAADDRVTGVQDVISHPELAEALTSADGKATYLPVGLTGGVGSPEANRQIDFLREAADQGKPAQLRTYVTGASATITDLQATVDDSIATITVVTVLAIGLILLLIYRSLVTAAIALATIGVALALSRSTTALLGLTVFDVSTFTGAFLTAIVLGAGTDYSVFLISRFHEERRKGAAPLAAVTIATRRVSPVITASAVTVVAASLSMGLADLGVFSTAGPAIAASIMVTLLTALTLTPALLAMAALRGRAEPTKRTLATGIWASAGALVARRPARVLLVGLIVLGTLAAFYPSMRLSYDERAVQPASTESNRGYDALAEHFPANEVLPDYVLIHAEHDMRNPRDLAAIEVVSASIAKVDGVQTVRSVTRPQGEPLDEASLGHQAGQVGDALADAGERLADGEAEADQLTDGAGQLAGGAQRAASGAGELAHGARQAVAGVDRLLDGLLRTQDGLGEAVDGADDARAGSRALADGAGELAVALRLAHEQTKPAVDGLGEVHRALSNDPLCSASPVCKRSRAAIGEIHDGQRDQLLPGLNAAADAAAEIAEGNTDLATGLGQLHAGLAEASAGVGTLSDAQQRFGGKLGELATGASDLAGGVGELAIGADGVNTGTDELVAATKELRSGLDEAAEFLRTAAAESDDPAIGGFYLPSGALDDPRMALARSYYLAEDGRTARLVVLGETDPFGHEAMQRSAEIQRAAASALPGTSLEHSKLAITGPAAINADLERMSADDFGLVAIVALISVFAILIFLLRSVIAPLYLMASILISYAAAMGLGVLVWQHLLGHDLEWSVPAIAFVILVAVGADYNLLLVSRIREESESGSREGIARAVTATGGVITSAGVIFAVSFLAMMTGAVTTLAQLGFTVGVGLLIDTFVVRTLVVPAVAALLGRWNWWPGRVRTARGLATDAPTAYEEGAHRTEPPIRYRLPQPEH